MTTQTQRASNRVEAILQASEQLITLMLRLSLYTVAAVDGETARKQWTEIV